MLVEFRITDLVTDSTCQFSERSGETFVVDCPATGIENANISPPEFLKLARFLFRHNGNNGKGTPASAKPVSARAGS